MRPAFEGRQGTISRAAKRLLMTQDLRINSDGITFGRRWAAVDRGPASIMDE